MNWKALFLYFYEVSLSGHKRFFPWTLKLDYIIYLSNKITDLNILKKIKQPFIKIMIFKVFLEIQKLQGSILK